MIENTSILSHGIDKTHWQYADYAIAISYDYSLWYLLVVYMNSEYIRVANV